MITYKVEKLGSMRDPLVGYSRTLKGAKLIAAEYGYPLSAFDITKLNGPTYGEGFHEYTLRFSLTDGQWHYKRARRSKC